MSNISLLLNNLVENSCTCCFNYNKKILKWEKQAEMCGNEMTLSCLSMALKWSICTIYLYIVFRASQVHSFSFRKRKIIKALTTVCWCGSLGHLTKDAFHAWHYQLHDWIRTAISTLLLWQPEVLWSSAKLRIKINLQNPKNTKCLANSLLSCDHLGVGSFSWNKPCLKCI